MTTIDWSRIVPEAYIYGAFGVVVTGLLTIARFVVKRAIATLQEEWKLVTARLERIEDVQGVQAENHLQTIQGNTAKTNEILDAMRLEQAESNGYLRAITHGYMKSIAESAPEVAKIIKPTTDPSTTDR